MMPIEDLSAADQLEINELLNDMNDVADETSAIVDNTPELYCETCGKQLEWSGSGRHPKYCADHRTVASRKAPAKKTSNNRSNTASNRRATNRKNNRAATLDEWQEFNKITLIVITYIFGRFLAGGKGLLLRQPNELTENEFDQATEYYAMTDEEAIVLGNFVSSRVLETGFNKKYGHVIISTLELEDVGYAMWGYTKRVGPAFLERIKVIKPIKNNNKGRTNGKVNGTSGEARPLTNREIVRLARTRQYPINEQGNPENS